MKNKPQSNWDFISNFNLLEKILLIMAMAVMVMVVHSLFIA